MLQHLENQETMAANWSQPAEELRVTPEELALAAAALEARRDAEHQHKQETIPLSDAIAQIGLHATPAELTPEIIALRARQLKEAQQKQKETQQKQKEQTLRRANRLGLISVFTAMAAIVLLVFFGMHTLIQSKQLHHTLPTSTVSLPIQPLSTVPDNTLVHVASKTLAYLAFGVITPTQAFVDTRPVNENTTTTTGRFNNEWTLVKSGKDLYVRAWATADQALEVSNNQSASVFSSRPAWLPQENLVPVQLPVYRFADSTIAGLNTNGTKADTATSVAQGADVDTTDNAIQSIVKNYILASDDKFSAQSYNSNYITSEVKGNVVHLKGEVTTPALETRATALAEEVLKRLNINDTVVNEMTRYQNPP